ncbi:MAG: hypothetical protein JWR15_2427 [Prosthecobacter sp.]|nr:hypothetical protein [Prosthecobacter sp.]
MPSFLLKLWFEGDPVKADGPHEVEVVDYH